MPNDVHHVGCVTAIENGETRIQAEVVSETPQQAICY